MLFPSERERKNFHFFPFFSLFFILLFLVPAHSRIPSLLSKQALIFIPAVLFTPDSELEPLRESVAALLVFARPWSSSPLFLSFPVPAFGDRAVCESLPRSGLWLVAEWQWRVLGEIWRTESASHDSNNVSASGSARPEMPHPKCPLSPRPWQRATDLIPLLLLAAVGLQLCVCVWILSGCCFELYLKQSEICAIPVSLLILWTHSVYASLSI